ncbi:MAG: AmmeMemoRadiSam system radical SAM enzyme [Candidatus Cloacimonetes bacterium]|nr:AmmeMemoRadiSam system radical SAM enzyme [Candidatus Cloacimonadota bacterium]
MFYKSLGEKSVQCELCPHFCTIGEGSRGLCRMRFNKKGILQAQNYGRSIVFALDPIEKKPLYHFFPGSRILSLGPNSCNLSCFFCQNFQSSQFDCPTHELSPEDLKDYLLAHLLNQVAFTYTEPLTWYEYIYDFSCLCQSEGIRIVLVSNGYINPEPIKIIARAVSAMNIDLKAFDDSFYRTYCKGSLNPVLATIRFVYEAGIHLEITNLLIPGLNDDQTTIGKLIDFLASLDPDIPLHFSAYHPAFKAKIASTPASVVQNACQMAKEKLKHVYAGNCSVPEFQDTYCPGCGRVLVSRSNYALQNVMNKSNTCPHCGTEIYGVFS